MYYNGNNRYPINSFLGVVHRDMSNKYLKSGEIAKDKKNALELQKFFQELKTAAKDSKTTPIEDETIRLIVTQIENIGIRQHGKNFNIQNLFSLRGGARFENEITRVIQSVYENLTDNDFIFNKKNVNIGSERANIDLLDEVIVSESAQSILKTVGTKTQKYFEIGENNKIKQYYLQDVDGKIDVQGYSINITKTPTPRMLEIYDLLKDATFTAKNYDTIGGTWEERLKGLGTDISYRPISLGKTNPFRAIYSVLTDLGYEHKVAISAISHGINKIKKENNQDTSTHFYHIRYLYELTGAGLLYNGKSFGIAKYMIYNDPSGGIYVRSTRDIVNEFFAEGKIPGNPFGHITLERARAKSK